MKRKGVLRSIVFGSLAAAAVGLFVFNLNLYLEREYYLPSTFDRLLWTGLAAVFLVALFVWSVVDAVKKTREPEPQIPTDQEKWEEEYPKPAVEPRAEKPKEKHGPGYWVKEFLRLAGIPVLLILAIWLGAGYLLHLL